MSPAILPASVPYWQPATHPNYFAVLSIEEEDDDITVVASNCSDNEKSDEATATTANWSDDDSWDESNLPAVPYIAAIPTSSPD